MHHVDALWVAAQDPKTWEFSSAVIRSADECRKYVETALSWPLGVVEGFPPGSW